MGRGMDVSVSVWVVVVWGWGWGGVGGMYRIETRERLLRQIVPAGVSPRVLLP